MQTSQVKPMAKTKINYFTWYKIFYVIKNVWLQIQRNESWKSERIPKYLQRKANTNYLELVIPVLMQYSKAIYFEAELCIYMYIKDQRNMCNVTYANQSANKDIFPSGL